MVKEKIKLSLGSRDRVIEGFKNMDIDAHPGVEFVGDVSDLSRFEDGSVSEIMASHILEHFEYHRCVTVLKEWLRVLENGGKLYVAVPDFERCVELYGMVGLNEWIVRFLCGDQEYKTAFHYNLFDEGRLLRLLAEAGFADAFRVEQFDMSPENDCSNLASTVDGVPVSLNMIAVKGAA